MPKQSKFAAWLSRTKRKKNKKKVSFNIPHMEWNNERNKFEKTKPEASPKVRVKISMMEDIHKKFGVNLNKRSKTKMMDAITDSGCQTTTCGVEILQTLNIDEKDLIPTNHGMIAICDTSLGVIGSVFAEITMRGKTSRQMIHVATKIKGLYLSQRACRDLGVIHANFPDVDSYIATAKEEIKFEKEKCKCLPRDDGPTRPSQIPFHPTEGNKNKLKKWLISAFKGSAFNTCTHQPLKKMSGKPMRIVFKKNTFPSAVHTPIRVPVHWKDKVKEDIDRDVRLGIIEEVPQGTPTTWCARMVVQAKKNGEPRRTVDLQQLKKATLRETHYTPTPFDIVSVIPSDTYKTVLDAWNGYHSLPLDEDSKDATTFITEWGRYRYCRAPQGYHASGDAYTRRFDDITSDFDRVSRCIDDSLLWDQSIEASFWPVLAHI